MPHAATSQSSGRPVRVKLAGSVLAMIRLENGRLIRGKLHQVSITGGLLHLDQPLAEKIKVEVMFHVGECTVRNGAMMLFPMWATQGCLQPFKFADLPEAERTALDRQIGKFREQGSLAVSFP